MMIRLFASAAAFALLLFPLTLSAQTIATQPLPKAGFCRGEVVSVDYTVTGAFVAGNAFIVQLSDPNGSFTSGFTNLASVSSTSSGSIAIELGEDISDGSSYRVRVISSNPRVDGSDNGTDLSIQGVPYVEMRTSSGGFKFSTVFLNRPVQFNSTIYGAASYEWNFGSGASPATSLEANPTVTFSTTGQKTVSLTAVSPNGCTITRTLTLTVRETDPVIPVAAVIVQGTVEFERNSIPDFIWVCPGGSCKIKDGLSKLPTIYAEAGSRVVVGFRGNGMAYLKSGASLSYDLDGYGVSQSDFMVIAEPGAGLPTPSRNADYVLLEVPSITFDYSNVPPGGCPSLAPYTVQIKPNTNSIHTAQNDNRSDAEYWVRDGGALTSTGEGNAYYVEAGGHVVVEGSHNRVYVKNGGTVDVQSGSENRIFYELQGTIVNSGADAILLPSSGITFESEVSGVREESVTAGGNLIAISPNPAEESVEVRVDPVLGPIRQVTLFNMLGEAVIRTDNVAGSTARLSVENFPAGLYHVRVRTDRTEIIRKLVVR